MENYRLINLRKQMELAGIDVYYLNTSDYHMSEYVPEYFKTIEYFSYFTGSLATLLVSKDDAYIFVDGRYHSQADKQCLPNDVKVMKLGLAQVLDPIEFIKRNYKDKIIGVDGKRSSIAFVKSLLEDNIDVRSIDLYSDIIENRTPLNESLIYELDIKYTGLSRKKKIEIITHVLKNKCHIVSNLEAIAYLLNLRSNDIKHTPVFLSYLVILDKKVYLFVDKSRFASETLNNLINDGIEVIDYNFYYEFISSIKNKDIIIDENKINYETYYCIYRDNRIINDRSLIDDMKSIKNPIEQNNIKLAHIYDGVSFLRFMIWLKNNDMSKYNEYQIAKVIDKARTSYKAIDTSFGSIVAYNENSAIIHYSPTENDSKRLDNSGLLLLDTGGQYLEGTTDITRCLALGEVSDEVKKYFCVVLRSMFNLSRLKFVKGIKGNQIDVLARKQLWEMGLDYRHGTGHGVGYLNSVHENPPNIRYMETSSKTEEAVIQDGMVFSDEPGVYFENKFGIRCENLLLAKKDYVNEFGQFMKFETLTMVPFDLNLIDKKYLDEETINALNDYHELVYKTLLPYISSEEEKYLREFTRKI